MSRLILILGLLLAACDVSAATAPESRLLLIDDSIKHVYLQPNHSSFQSRDVRPAGGFPWEPEPPGFGEKLAGATVAVLLMGPSGAGYAMAQGQAEALQARREWLEPLLRILAADDALQKRALASLRTGLAGIGMPVDRIVISSEAKGSILQRAARDESLAVVIRARQGAMVSLTPEDRRVVLDMWIENHERPNQRFRHRTGHFPLRYVSAAMEGARAIDLWAKDDAAHFWGELDRGLRALVSASVMEMPGEVGEEERVALDHAGRGERFHGRLMQRVGDMAYIAEPDGGLMIVHDRVPLESGPGKEGSDSESSDQPSLSSEPET